MDLVSFEPAAVVGEALQTSAELVLQHAVMTPCRLIGRYLGPQGFKRLPDEADILETFPRSPRRYER